DLDVATSVADALVAVWINDGTGHFTRDASPQPSSFGARPASTLTVPRDVAGAVGSSPRTLTALLRLHDSHPPPAPASAPAVARHRSRRLRCFPHARRPLLHPPVSRAARPARVPLALTRHVRIGFAARPARPAAASRAPPADHDLPRSAHRGACSCSVRSRP